MARKCHEVFHCIGEATAWVACSLAGPVREFGDALSSSWKRRRRPSKWSTETCEAVLSNASVLQSSRDVSDCGREVTYPELNGAQGRGRLVVLPEGAV